MGQPNEGPNGGVGKKDGDLVRTRRWKNQLELAFGAEVRGEAPSAASEGAEARAAAAAPDGPAVPVGPTMERIVARDNLRKALAQVRRNKGAPGVDAMSVDDLAAYLKDHWPAIQDQLLHGTYSKKTAHNTCRGEGVDECVSWGDYYYLEALIRLSRNWSSYW